jgi:uncharacterized protein (TIGR02001 family)
MSKEAIYRKTIRSIRIGLIVLALSPKVFGGIGFQTDVTFVSRYIWRGFDTIVDDQPAIQPSLTISFGKSGLWLNLWSASALADTNFVELDFVAGYDRQLFRYLTLSLGAGYFTFPSMPGYPDQNSTTPEAYAGITARSFPFSPALILYYDFNLGDGLYATLSLENDFRLKRRMIHSSVLLGYTNQYQDLGVDPDLSDICLGISTDFHLMLVTLTPSVNYVFVPNKTINDEDEVWVGLSVGWQAK